MLILIKVWTFRLERDLFAPVEDRPIIFPFNGYQKCFASYCHSSNRVSPAAYAKKRMSKVTKNRFLPVTIFSYRPNTQQNSPPSSLCIFYQVCMPGILHLIIDSISP